jgi:16S rRNA (uracil1498-N3)-methyltransferase
MGRFFFHPLLKEQDVIALLPEEAHHLQVERIGFQDRIFLSDGQGKLFQGLYLGKREGKFWVKVEEKVGEERPLFQIKVWQALLHSPSRVDWLVEKLTEVGVSTIGLFPARRSVASFVSSRRMERWQKIILSACKQSGRFLFPELRLVRDWNDFLSTLGNIPGIILLADASASESLWRFMQRRMEEKVWSLVIGPEGDFTDEEKKDLLSLPGVFRVRLFSRILRSETAGFFCASILSGFLDGVYADCLENPGL